MPYCLDPCSMEGNENLCAFSDVWLTCIAERERGVNEYDDFNSYSGEMEKM